MDESTRKLMSMHLAFQPRDDIHRLYVSRKEGSRGYASIEYSVDSSIGGVKTYFKKNFEGLINVANNSICNISSN